MRAAAFRLTAVLRQERKDAACRPGRGRLQPHVLMELRQRQRGALALVAARVERRLLERFLLREQREIPISPFGLLDAQKLRPGRMPLPSANKTRLNSSMLRAALGPRLMITLPPRRRCASNRSASLSVIVGTSHRKTQSYLVRSARKRSANCAAVDQCRPSGRIRRPLADERRPQALAPHPFAGRIERFRGNLTLHDEHGNRVAHRDGQRANIVESQVVFPGPRWRM